MVLNGTHGELSIPVAVDHRGRGYLLTVCLGSLHKLDLSATEIYFATRQVFRNPSHPGNYRFIAMVFPLGANGKPDPKTRYEMRGTQPIPETAKPKAVYNPATKMLTVVGDAPCGGEAARRHQRPRLRRHDPGVRQAEGARRGDDREGRRVHLHPPPVRGAEVGLRLRLPLSLPDLLGRLVGPRRLREPVDRWCRNRRGAGRARHDHAVRLTFSATDTDQRLRELRG